MLPDQIALLLVPTRRPEAFAVTDCPIWAGRRHVTRPRNHGRRIVTPFRALVAALLLLAAVPVAVAVCTAAGWVRW